MQILKSALLATLVCTIVLGVTMAQPKKAGNWTPLFNGIDLTGWTQLNG